MNKRGILADWQVLVVFMLVVAIFILFMTFVWGNVSSALQNTTLADDEDSVTILGIGDSLINGLDVLFVFLFFGVGMSLMLVALLTDTSSIFFWLSLLVLAFMVVVSAILSNVFDAIANSSVLSATALSMPVTTFVLDKYPLWIFMFIFFSAIIFYTKNQLR